MNNIQDYNLRQADQENDAIDKAEVMREQVTSQDLLDRGYLDCAIDDLLEVIVDQNKVLEIMARPIATKMLLALNPDELLQARFITLDHWNECASEIQLQSYE